MMGNEMKCHICGVPVSYGDSTDTAVYGLPDKGNDEKPMCQDCYTGGRSVERLAVTIKKQQAEIDRMRECARAAPSKTIRVEIPSQENGMAFVITAPAAKSEEYIAEILKGTMLVFIEAFKEVNKKGDE